MANKFTISTVFTAVDQVTKTVDKMGKNVDTLGTKMAKVAKGIGTGLAAVGAVAIAAGKQMWDLVNDVSNAGDEIAKTASAIGMSTDALQEFRYIGERSGVSVDEMTVALKKLTINLGDASREVTSNLERLGLSVDELKAAGPDKSLILVADAMAKITDPTERAAIAVDLFGKGGVKLANVLADGSEGMAKLASEAHRVGYVMSAETLAASEKLNDSILNMNTSFKAIGISLGSKLMGPVNRIVDKMTEMAVAGRSGMVDGLVQIGEVLSGTFESLLPVIDAVFGVAAPALNLVAKIFKGVQPVFTTVGKILTRVIPIVSKLADVIGVALAPVFDILAAALEPIFPLFDALMPVIEFLVDWVGFLAAVIAATLKPAIDVMTFLFKGLRDIIAAVPGFIISVWNGIPGFFKGLWDGIVAGADAAWKWIQDGIGFVVDAVGGAIKGVADFIGGVFDGIVDGIIGAVNLIIDGINLVGGAFGAQMDKIPTMAESRRQQQEGAPASPNAAAITSKIVQQSQMMLDVNFNNAPAGTSVKQTGSAPGVTLKTGFAGAR